MFEPVKTSSSAISNSPYLLSAAAVVVRRIDAHHVVFANAILVPTSCLKQQRLSASHGKLHGLVPFWVEGFGD